MADSSDEDDFEGEEDEAKGVNFQKLWAKVDRNAMASAFDSKLETISGAVATRGQATTQVLGRVGRVVGDDVKKVGKRVSKFIDSKKELAVAAQGLRDGLEEAGMVVTKLKKGASKMAQGFTNKLSKDDWDEEGDYEPPRIVGLPDKELYSLSVDENQQQNEGLFRGFFVKIGLQRQQQDLSRQLARLLQKGVTIKDLLGQETDLNLIRDDYGGFTLLQLAIIVDDFEMAKELLEKGASPNQTDHNGHTPLHIALMVEGKNLSKIIDLLCSAGADVNLRDKDKRTALHWCAQTSRVDVLSVLVEKGAVLNTLDSRYHTELLQAVIHEQTEIVRWMVDHGADLLATDPWGRTALHFAAAIGNQRVCELLLAKQHDLLEAEDGFLWTPIFYAATEGRVHILKLFIEKHDLNPNREFPVTTWRGSGAWLKKWAYPAGEVLAGGARRISKMVQSQESTEQKEKGKAKEKEKGKKKQNVVFQEESFPMSLLHRVAMKGHLEACSYLLEKGKIEVDRPQLVLERTPLHLACAEGHPKVVKLLLERGANGNAKDKYSFAPLHFACLGDHYLYVELKPKTTTVGHLECAILLLEAGVERDPRVTTRTALAEVALYGTQGCTPLHFATMRGDVQLVRTLLKNGCDPEIVSHRAVGSLFSGLTPIGLCSFQSGIVVYGCDKVLSFASAQRTATVWEMSHSAQHTLQQLWQKYFHKFPRMEGVAMEEGVQRSSSKDRPETKVTWTKRVFVLGITSLKLYNYSLMAQHLDEAVAKLSFADSTIEINPLEEYNGKMNSVQLSSKSSGLKFVMAFKSNTAKVEWLAALQARFSPEQSKNSKNEKFCQFRQAAARGSYEAIREYLKKGVNVNEADKDGRTVLHIAAINGHFQVVEELLAHGADVNKAAKGGQTPLHSVAFWGCTIRFDLPWWMSRMQAYYGRYDAKEVNNLNPRSAIAYLLLQWGADPKALNEEGLTPFDLAKDFPMKWVTFHGKTYGASWLFYYVTDTAMKGWDRYWAVLTSDTIYLHHSAPSLTNVQGVEGTIKRSWTTPATSVKLQGAKVQLHLRDPLRRNGFEILTKEGITKVFSISDQVSKSDEDLLHTWVEKIQRRIRVLTEPTSKTEVTNIPSTVAQLNQLHDVVRTGDVVRLRDLVLREGRDPNYIRASDGRAPLHIAVKYNQLKAVEELISLKANPLLEDKSGWTAVHIAAWMSYIDILSCLLSHIPPSRIWADVTPIHRAAEANKSEVIEFLLKGYGKMFDVNAQESLYLDTPLHIAARLGNTKSVESLLKFSAKTNVKNRSSKSPAQVAATHAIKKVLETGFNYIRGNELERLQELVNKDKSVLSKLDFQGYSMIHVAAQEGRARILDFILTTKSDALHSKATDGSTPLHVAAKSGQVEAVKLLLNAGAKVNAYNQLQDTPLHFAVMNGHQEVAAQLLRKGADPKASNVNLQTPETLDAFNILNTRSSRPKSLMEPSPSRNSFRLSTTLIPSSPLAVTPDRPTLSKEANLESSPNLRTNQIVDQRSGGRVVPQKSVPSIPGKTVERAGTLDTYDTDSYAPTIKNPSGGGKVIQPSLKSDDVYGTENYAPKSTSRPTPTQGKLQPTSDDVYGTDNYAPKLPPTSAPIPTQDKPQPPSEDLYSTDNYAPKLIPKLIPSGGGTKSKAQPPSEDLYCTDNYAPKSSTSISRPLPAQPLKAKLQPTSGDMYNTENYAPKSIAPTSKPLPAGTANSKPRISSGDLYDTENYSPKKMTTSSSKPPPSATTKGKLQPTYGDMYNTDSYAPKPVPLPTKLLPPGATKGKLQSPGVSDVEATDDVYATDIHAPKSQTGPLSVINPKAQPTPTTDSYDTDAYAPRTSSPQPLSKSQPDVYETDVYAPKAHVVTTSLLAGRKKPIPSGSADAYNTDTYAPNATTVPSKPPVSNIAVNAALPPSSSKMQPPTLQVRSTKDLIESFNSAVPSVLDFNLSQSELSKPSTSVPTNPNDDSQTAVEESLATSSPEIESLKSEEVSASLKQSDANPRRRSFLQSNIFRSLFGRGRSSSGSLQKKVVAVHLYESQQKVVVSWKATKPLSKIFRKVCKNKKLSVNDYCLVPLENPNTALDLTILLGDLSFAEFALIAQTSLGTVNLDVLLSNTKDQTYEETEGRRRNNIGFRRSLSLKGEKALTSLQRALKIADVQHSLSESSIQADKALRTSDAQQSLSEANLQTTEETTSSDNKTPAKSTKSKKESKEKRFDFRKSLSPTGEKALTSLQQALKNEVELPKGFNHKYASEFPSDSPATLLHKVKEALARYHIFDDECANLENSSVNAAFGMLAGGGLAPSVAVFPLMFPEVQGWLKYSSGGKLPVWSVWVSIGRTNSKTGDYIIGYKSIPVSSTNSKKNVKPNAMFYFSMQDIESVIQRKATSCSFSITLKNRTTIRLKAESHLEAQAWARICFGSVLAKRDWNEEFQLLVDKGLGLQEEHTTKDQQQTLNEAFGKLVREFTALAGVLTSVIVAERWIPSDQTRLVPPMSDSGAGGQKFLTHNIFIKFAIMLEDCHFYHGEEEQAKASELELKSLNAYMRCAMRSFSKARFPLMSMFDYRGLRLSATTCLPLKEIIYGSDDRGQTVHASVPEFNNIMRTLGTQFNIKPHMVYSKDAKKILAELRSQGQLDDAMTEKYSNPPFGAEIVACGDIEGHLGKDQRFYLLDTARLFPPAAWSNGGDGLYFGYIQGSFLCRMLRPEFLQRWSRPISSDVFCKWGSSPINDVSDKNNADAVQATLYLEQKLVPSTATSLEQTFLPFLPSTNAVDREGSQLLRELIVEIHSRGINVRYLGLLRSYLKPSLLSSLIFTEMVSRVVKSWMNSEMRGLQTTDFIAHQQLICDLFNQVFLSTDSAFWKMYVLPQLTHKFGSKVKERNVQSVVDQIHWLVMFERIQQMMSIFWKEEAKIKVHLGNIYLAESDIQLVTPRAKHLFIVAKQNAFFAQSKNTPAEGTTLVKIRLGTTVLNVRPQWRHVLNKWLETIERYPSDGEAICCWIDAHTSHKVYLQREKRAELAKQPTGSRGIIEAGTSSRVEAEVGSDTKVQQEFGILHIYEPSFASNDAQQQEASSYTPTIYSTAATNWRDDLPEELFAQELARYQLALRVEPSNPIIYCRYANFLYRQLGNPSGAETQLMKAKTLNPKDPRIDLQLHTFEHFKKKLFSTSSPTLSASSPSFQITTTRQESSKAIRKQNSTARLHTGDTKALIDPTLLRHRQLIDALCFDLVTKSPPFKVRNNESIGKTRDAKAVITNILIGAKAKLQLKEREKDNMMLQDAVMIEIPFGRGHAVDFIAPVERDKRDWVGCFPVVTGKETEEERCRMSLMACDVHQNIFVEKKKLFFFDHVTVAKRDQWQQVEHAGLTEGTLCFPSRKRGIKEVLSLAEEGLNKLPEGMYEYRYYRMKGDLFFLLEYAQQLMDVGDFGGANLFFKQALDLAPRHEEVTCCYARFLFCLSEKMKLLMGNKLYAKGVKIYLKRADKVLKRGLNTNPAHIPSLLTRSEIFLHADPSRAAKYAERVLRGDPYNVTALLLFAESAVAAKQFPLAERYFKNALSLNSGDMDILMAYGILNARAGDYEKAEGVFAKAILLYPENPVLLSSYFDNILSTTQVVSHSHYVIDKLLKAEPMNANHMLRKANFLWKSLGDLQNAEKTLIKACDLDTTPNSLTQRIIFIREVQDNLMEANKLQRTVIFNSEYRQQEKWEFFVTQDNEAFTYQKTQFVKKLLNFVNPTLAMLMGNS